MCAVSGPKYFVRLVFPTIKRDYAAIPILNRHYFLHQKKVTELTDNAIDGIML